MKLDEEMPSPSFVDLKPDRDLLDPNFNGYKLSLDRLPSYAIDLKLAIDKVTPEDDQYSIQHAQLFAQHNFLHADPWNARHFYVVDARWNVSRFTFNTLSREVDKFDEPVKCWEIPSKEIQRPGRFNVTVKFPDEKTAMLADGCGNLFIVETQDRSGDATEWKLLHQANFSKELDKKLDQFILLDCRKYCRNGDIFIDSLLVRVKDKGEDNLAEILESHQNQFIKNCMKHPFVTTIDWVTVKKGNLTWDLSSTRTLIGPSGVIYACIETDGNGILVASENHFAFFHVSDQPLKYANQMNKTEAPDADEEKRPDYVWKQSSEEVTVWYRIPLSARKADFNIKITASSISCTFNGRLVLEGELQHNIKHDESFWQISSSSDSNDKEPSKKYQCLEITLTKSENGIIWDGNSVVKGDVTGKQIIDPEVINGIHDNLEYLCSDKWDSDLSRADIFDGQQLEECDEFPSDTTSIMRLDKNLQCITHIASLGTHQWLFSTNSRCDKLPSICVRHDVDGLIWQPGPYLESKENCQIGEWKLSHIATFSAMGYVQASKQHRRFTVCPDDFSYVAIVDAIKHVYLYRQPNPVATDLRNRRTGERISHLAKQQVVPIDPPTDIFGAFAGNDFLFVLTAGKLHAVRIHCESSL